MKNSKGINFWIYIISVLPFLYVGYVWESTPDIIPTHWNINGEADGFGSKNTLIWLPLLLMGITLFIYHIVPRIDPKKRFEQMGDSFEKIMFLMACLMSALSIFIIYSATSSSVTKNNFITAILGLFFMALGNYLPTVKPNYFVGIRTPWTLEHESVWRKTHRLAGRLFMIGGLFVTVFSFLVAPRYAFYLLMIMSTVIVLIPAVFSYLEYRKMDLG